jgi:hypothetical protein
VLTAWLAGSPTRRVAAFAKFCGSYKHLDGGWALWGWRVLTGDHVFRLELEDDKWLRRDFEAKRCKAAKDGIDGVFKSTKESYNSKQVWKCVRRARGSHPTSVSALAVCAL